MGSTAAAPPPPWLLPACSRGDPLVWTAFVCRCGGAARRGKKRGEVRAKGGTEQCVILGGAATQHRQVRLSYATVYPSSLGCCGAGAQWPAPSGAQLVAVTMLSTVHHLPCWRLRLWLRCGSTLVWQSHCGGYRVFSCVSTTPPAAPRCRLFAVCLSGDYTFGCAATAHCSGGGAVSCTVGRAASCVRECPSVGCNTLSTDLPHRLLRLLQLQQLAHQLHRLVFHHLCRRQRRQVR